jgi:hypothetical protein
MTQQFRGQILDNALTPREQDLQKTFFNLLRMDGKKVFSADDFYEYGLDRFLSDPAHMVGSLFRKFMVNGFCEKVGHIRSTRSSNNGRETKLWRVKQQ